MKYDFSRCNNLEFKAKNEEGSITGYLKVSKGGDVYVYTDRKDDEAYDACLQLDIRDWEYCCGSEDFIKWAERRELEILPRDPETYNDWKVGDRVCCALDPELVYVIAAKLGEVVFLLKNNYQVLTLPIDILVDDFNLILTDYEKELIHAQELEEKQKECPFKEGDKVLVRDYDSSEWRFAIFESYDENSVEPYRMQLSVLSYRQCIPLNERTWKLLGTTGEYKATNNNESH